MIVFTFTLTKPWFQRPMDIVPRDGSPYYGNFFSYEDALIIVKNSLSLSNYDETYQWLNRDLTYENEQDFRNKVLRCKMDDIWSRHGVSLDLNKTIAILMMWSESLYFIGWNPRQNEPFEDRFSQTYNSETKKFEVCYESNNITEEKYKQLEAKWTLYSKLSTMDMKGIDIFFESISKLLGRVIIPVQGIVNYKEMPELKRLRSFEFDQSLFSLTMNDMIEQQMDREIEMYKLTIAKMETCIDPSNKYDVKFLTLIKSLFDQKSTSLSSRSYYPIPNLEMIKNLIRDFSVP